MAEKQQSVDGKLRSALISVMDALNQTDLVLRVEMQETECSFVELHNCSFSLIAKKTIFEAWDRNVRGFISMNQELGSHNNGGFVCKLMAVAGKA